MSNKTIEQLREQDPDTLTKQERKLVQYANIWGYKNDEHNDEHMVAENSEHVFLGIHP